MCLDFFLFLSTLQIRLFSHQFLRGRSYYFFGFSEETKTEVKSLDQGYTISDRFQIQGARTLCVKEGGVQWLSEG